MVVAEAVFVPILRVWFFILHCVGARVWESVSLYCYGYPRSMNGPPPPRRQQWMTTTTHQLISPSPLQLPDSMDKSFYVTFVFSGHLQREEWLLIPGEPSGWSDIN